MGKFGLGLTQPFVKMQSDCISYLNTLLLNKFFAKRPVAEFSLCKL